MLDLVAKKLFLTKGIGVILLNIGIYFVAPAVPIINIKKLI